MKRVTRVAAVSLILLACQDVPVPTEMGPPQFEIVDAAHGGNDHFFFLPPMVPAPSPTGVFEATRSPTVEICKWVGEECDGPLLAEFTTTTGLASETIRVSTEDEHYIVNWHTDQFAMETNATYRIRVLELAAVLGFADVVVGSNKELKNSGTDDFIALEDGRTLPIKFRIEEGLPFVVDENGGPISAAGGDVVIMVPSGAVLEGSDPVPVTVEEVPIEDETLPEGTDVLPGTVFDFGPEGTEFAKPVEITVAYDPAIIPAGVPEEGLRLFTLVDGRWQLLLDGSADKEKKTVTGFTDHFSTFGMLSISVFCSTAFDGITSFETFSEAFDAVIPGGTIEVCDGTHVVEGVVIDAPVTIQPQADAAPVIRNNSDSASFWVDGVLTGTVQFQNLAFDNQSPATRSYSIRPRGTYDQVIVDSSTFSVSPAGSGGIRGSASTVSGSRITVLNSSFTGGAFAVLADGAVLDVSNSTFNDQTNRAAQYQFASGVFQGNTMTNCGGVACIRPFQSDVTVIGNTITGVGQSTALFSSGSHVVFTDNVVSGDFTFSVVQMQNGSTGRVDSNTISGCGLRGCIRLFIGAVEVIGNTLTNDVSRAVENGIVANGGPNTISGNHVIGTGVIVDPNDASSYAYDVAGIQILGGTATLTGNDISNAAVGLLAALDAQILAGSEGNTIDDVFIGVSLPDNPQVLFHRNDVTGYVIPMDGGGLTPGSLTCNWWGNAAGPQGVDPGILAIVYTQFADMPIAGDDNVACDPSVVIPTLVRVSDTPNGIVTVATVQQALVTVAEGGTILIADGTHLVALQVSKSITIAAEGPAVPVIDAGGDCRSFTVDGSGQNIDVTIRGLRFVNATCESIAVQGSYGQVVIEQSEFDSPGVNGVSVFSGPPGGTVTVQDNDFVAAESNVLGSGAPDVRVLINDFTGLGTAVSLNEFTRGRIEGNTFSNCSLPAFACIISDNRSGAGTGGIDIIDNTMTSSLSNLVPSGILVSGGSFLIDGNTITGEGTSPSYSFTLAGIEVTDGAVATVSNNTIMYAFIGLQFGNDVTVTGTDNVVDNVDVGVQAFASGDITITSSDFTNYVRSMEIFSLTQVLTCNWWGIDTGPVNPNTPVPSEGIFTPWATAPVAGTSTTMCSGGLP